MCSNVILSPFIQHASNLGCLLSNAYKERKFKKINQKDRKCHFFFKFLLTDCKVYKTTCIVYHEIQLSKTSTMRSLIDLPPFSIPVDIAVFDQSHSRKFYSPCLRSLWNIHIYYKMIRKEWEKTYA